MPNSPEKIRIILEEIIAVNTGNDYISFEIQSVEPIALAKKYAGIGASLIGLIKNTRTTFGIDFGVGDIVVPSYEKRPIPTQLNGFKSPIVNTYLLETTISEKIDAILDLMEFSSRMKDYYDIYYLSSRFDFNGESLSLAMKKTFSNRGHKYTVEQFHQMLSFDKDESMNKKWNSFLRKINEDTDFSVVLNRIDLFLSSPVTAALSESNFMQFWSVDEQNWIDINK